MNEVAKVDPAEVAEVPSQDIGSAALEMIAAAASNPDCDVSKMRELIAMRREVMDYEAEVAFNEAMAAAQAEMAPVVAKCRNNQTNSNYANLEALAKAIDPVIASHGFSQSYGQGEGAPEGFYRITMKLSRGGHSRDYKADVPIDAAGLKGNANKTATHAFGSTMSYGRRYIKLMAWDIATTDDDDGAAAGAGQTITADQFQALRAKIELAGADEDKLCAHFKISQLPELPQARYGQADAMLDQKIAKEQANA